MVDEQLLRRPTFAEGVRIRLADGQAWSLPDHPPYREDDEHIAVLRAIGEAEEALERTRCELVLAIVLLSRNYDLTSRDYQAILGYAPGDPALAEMQRAVHALARKQCQGLRRLPKPDPNAHSPLPRPHHCSLGNFLRRQNRVAGSRPRRRG